MKENILMIISERNTKLINAVHPESYLVILFMVYAFHMVNISSILCMHLNVCFIHIIAVFNNM